MALNKSKDIKELKKFDVDLEFGQQWEKHIDEMFSGAKKCEVKTERDKWASTGNIFSYQVGSLIFFKFQA